jgi:hypothetical protein
MSLSEEPLGGEDVHIVDILQRKKFIWVCSWDPAGSGHNQSAREFAQNAFRICFNSAAF